METNGDWENNFFIEEKFYSGIDVLIDDILYDEDCEIEDLDENYEIEIGLTDLEPIFKLEMDFVVSTIMQNTDRWAERFPESDDDLDKEIEEAIKASIDIDKLNSLLPKLYYPNGKYKKLTKKDLL